jgi:twitching motility protein PilT
VIAQGEYYGMQTFDQGLCNAVVSGAIAVEDAMRYATAPHDLQLRLTAHARTDAA